MEVLLREAVRWVNLPYTIILIVTLIYWITVIIGTLDLELFDFDIELDGFWGFLNIGSLPFSIWMSIFGLQLWLYSIVINLIIDVIPLLSSIPDIIRFLPIAAGILILSLFTTKIITSPLKRLFKEKIDEKSGFIGKDCIITSLTVDENFGTAELITNGVPQIIDVICRFGETVVKNDKVLIADYSKEKDLFLVTKI